MPETVIPISHLFEASRDGNGIVAFGADSHRNWTNFSSDVAALTVKLEKTGGKQWLIAESDAYALAVGVLAALHANGKAILPANLQRGHLSNLALSVDGVISSAAILPDAIHTFDGSPSDATMALQPLDALTAEIVLHTSGTSGDPVALRKPLRCLEAETLALNASFAPCSGNAVLATVPPYHIYGLLFRVLWPLATARAFSRDLISYPEELVSAAENGTGSMLISSPAFLKRALSVLDLEHLKKFVGPIFSSGGLLPPPIAAAYNGVLSKPIVEVYGSTETGGIGYRSIMDAEAPAPWRPLPNVEIAIDKHERLTVRSPFLPENEWFLTSDRASPLPDGCFTLKGRADRVVKIEEQRVSLPEIERRLAECTTVELARVVQLASETRDRQILAAVIEPSETGWDMLAAEGRRSFRQHLLDVLKPYLAPVVLPRKWRFVTRIPEDDRGKTSQASLIALFDENQARRIAPIVIERESKQNSLTLHLELPEDLFYFAGHFDEAPILAGVVQIDWAINYAMAHFSIPDSFRRIEVLKFFKVLKANAKVTLQLQFDPETARLKFQYSKAETKYSSGRVVFETMP